MTERTFLFNEPLVNLVNQPNKCKKMTSKQRQINEIHVGREKAPKKEWCSI